MSDIDIATLGVPTFDSLNDTNELSENSAGAKDYVHIRTQQRNGKKCLTTVQGLAAAYDLKKVLKALKKEYCCNGTVVEDEDLGKVLQLQGDQRKNVAAFLVGNNLCKKEVIKVHGA